MATAPYSAACIQSPIREVRDADSKDEVIRENTYRIASAIDYVTGRFGAAKLVVLPEFSLQGFEHHQTAAETLGICIEIPGPEIDRLAEVAVDRGVYIGGNAFEVDRDWPGRWFNTAFLIDPEGSVVLRYRKIHCGSVTGNATNTSPADIYSQYLDRYGIDGLFPVVDTPLGRIAMMVCYDICFPEVARSLAMRGAEIILHPTGEPYGAHRSAWRQAKHTRAFENRVYLLSANHAAYYCQTDDGAWTDGDGLRFQERQRRPIAPSLRSHGRSEIIDFNGGVVAEIDGPGEAAITGMIDIEALRHARSQRAFNFLAQHMPQVYAPLYASAELRPTDGWADAPIAERAEARQFLVDRVRQLHDKGLLVPSVYDELSG